MTDLETLKRRADRLTDMVEAAAEVEAPWQIANLRRLQNMAAQAWHDYYEAELKSRPAT